MPLDVIHQPERDLTLFTLWGTPSVAEILHAYRDAKESHGLTKHTIWDSRRASVSHLTEHDLSMLNYFIALIQNQDPERVGGRSALLFSGVGDAVRFWNYAKLNYRVPQRLQVVLSMEDALAWVEQGVVPQKDIRSLV
ncbi:MAG: hypothetical protein KQI62_11675 [Deltaproteobacteria bacterium]|nr:hypothetical protein [Deltaproteobacteria bacterium]